MGMMFAIGMLSVETIQKMAEDIETGGSSLDGGEEELSETASALMYGVSLMMGLTMVGADPSGPAAQSMMEAAELVLEDPEGVVEAAEVECLSSSDCPPEWACVFSAGSEKGTCIRCGDIGVRIVGVIDSKTCAYCLSMIGRTGSLDSLLIPPYHKHCRCSVEYTE